LKNTSSTFALYKYMPFYRIGNFCIYDFAVGLIIAVSIWQASRRARPPAATHAV
jgi:oligoendopeptidase F